jgi:hypothetical protein
VIELDQGGSVFVLRLRSGENRFNLDWLATGACAVTRVTLLGRHILPPCRVNEV